MSADSGTAYDVYLGAWTDWSRGSVFGATLTVTRRDGTLIIAFLAFFVALVGTRFWRIACILLFHLYSNNSPSDGVYHQRQAFLRNGPNAEATFWTVATMGVSWRHNAERVWIRLIPLIGLATACIVGFTLAGGFSSRVTDFAGSNEVLLSGANCGFITNDLNMTTYGDNEGSRMAEGLIQAEAYARQCYTSAPVGVNCGTYVKKQLLPAVVDTNASCPFDAKICKSPTGNLFLDTGLLDTHDDFGRNAPTNQRLQFRRTVHCAPLVKEGYQSRTSDETTNQSYTTYYYGPLQNVNGSTTVNYTTRFSNDVYPDIEGLTQNSGDTVNDFSVRSHYAMHYNGTLDPDYSSFIPVPELSPENSGLFVFFLTSGRLLFSTPTNDPWYGPTDNTTEVHKLKFSKWGNTTMYRQSEPGSPLACRELEQYCWTGAKRQRQCTALQSPYNASINIFDLADKEDIPWLDWLQLTTFAVGMQTMDPLMFLGTHVLTARNKLSGPVLGTIADHQWQLEVQHWHATAMAYMQAIFLQSVIGNKDPKISHLVRYPNNTAEKELCKNQKILVQGFMSISIFGLTCILVGGVLIIIVSFTLPMTVPCCRKRRGRASYSKLEWSSNETFQLQRLAQEASGSALDVNDPNHPILQRTAGNHGQLEDQQSNEDIQEDEEDTRKDEEKP